MDRAELCKPVPGQGEAGCIEGASHQHRKPVQPGRTHAGVLVPAWRKGKVR